MTDSPRTSTFATRLLSVRTTHEARLAKARHSLLCGPPSPSQSPRRSRAWLANRSPLHALAPSERRLVGLSRFELLTPRLSSVCSNQLSYRPVFLGSPSARAFGPFYSPVSPTTHCQRAWAAQVPSKLDRAFTNQSSYIRSIFRLISSPRFPGNPSIALERR